VLNLKPRRIRGTVKIQKRKEKMMIFLHNHHLQEKDKKHKKRIIKQLPGRNNN
jgi:hypothetical protein